MTKKENDQKINKNRKKNRFLGERVPLKYLAILIYSVSILSTSFHHQELEEHFTYFYLSSSPPSWCLRPHFSIR